MGFVANALGLGSSYQAQGPTAGQLGTSYDQSAQGLGQQQALVNGLAGQNGIGNQSNVFTQQQALSGQLQDAANGGGPNPALDQLNQQTGNNIASQASLMAGQRGASSNAGLIARQAGMNGANVQQQAVGQAATLQAQQQVAARQQLQQQQQMMAGLAGQQVGQESNAIGQYGQAAQNSYGQLLGAQNNAQQLNAKTASSNAQGLSSLVGGIAGGIGALGTGGLFGGSSSAAGSGFNATNPTASTMPSLSMPTMSAYSKGGLVDGPKSRAGQHLAQFKAGGKVPGKASVSGDSPKNDTVRAMLSPGEIVVPRSAAMDPERAASFARAVSIANARKK